MPSITSRWLRSPLGRGIRTTRTSIGWSQHELARRAGTSRALVARVELGTVNVTMDPAGALCDALGLRAELILTPPFVTGQRIQRDAAHARCVAFARRRLQSAGWLTASEVEVVHGRSHGWIDLLGFASSTRRLVVVEIKTELDDLGRIERTLGWYEREAWVAARRLGWRPAATVGWLLVLATDENEARLHDNRESLRMAFPQRARTMLSDTLAGRGLA